MLKNIRIWFKKTSSAKYISHLDLSRCMSRAIRKAKLPFWYTEGYNPHVFLTITMPISLGYTGLRESMDVKLLDESASYDEMIDRLNAGLPEGVRVFDITEPVMKAGEVAFSSYDISIRTRDGEGLYEKFRELLSQDAIEVEKHTKKGIRLVDIKEYFMDTKFDFSGSGLLKMAMILPSSNSGSINPKLLFDAYTIRYGEEIYADIVRTDCFNEKMEQFR